MTEETDLETFSISDFFAELEAQPRRKKLYWKCYRALHRVLGFPKTLRYRIRHWVQRARRGWSDQDTWGFDMYLGSVISGGVASLRDRNLGYPANVCTTCNKGTLGHDIETCDGAERWIEIQDNIVEGFTIVERIAECSPNHMTDEEKIKVDRAFDLLKLHHRHLWD